MNNIIINLRNKIIIFINFYAIYTDIKIINNFNKKFFNKNV